MVRHAVVTFLAFNTLSFLNTVLTPADVNAQQIPGEKVVILRGQRITDESLTRLDLKDVTLLVLDNTAIGSEGLTTISRLPRLKCLCFDERAAFDAKAIACLKESKVVDLRLDGKWVTDEVLCSFSVMPRLQRLSLSNTSVSADGLSRALEKLDLRLLTLAAQNDWRGDVLIALREAPRLTDLIILDIDLSNSDLSPLLSLKHLHQLFLSETRMSDEQLVQLSAVSSLRQLVLDPGPSDNVLDALKACLPSCKVKRLGELKIEFAWGPLRFGGPREEKKKPMSEAERSAATEQTSKD